MTTTALVRSSLLYMALLALLSPSTTLAEGGVRLLDCTVTQACDAAGRCEASSEQLSFQMDPVALDPAGAGEYRISYADVEAEMRALSEAGPYFWVVGNERNTLLVSSEAEFLWHRLVLGEDAVASVRYLSCEVRQ